MENVCLVMVITCSLYELVEYRTSSEEKCDAMENDKNDVQSS